MLGSFDLSMFCWKEYDHNLFIIKSDGLLLDQEAELANWYNRDSANS